MTLLLNAESVARLRRVLASPRRRELLGEHVLMRLADALADWETMWKERHAEKVS